MSNWYRATIHIHFLLDLPRYNSPNEFALTLSVSARLMLTTNFSFADIECRVRCPCSILIHSYLLWKIVNYSRSLVLRCDCHIITAVFPQRNWLLLISRTNRCITVPRATQSTFIFIIIKIRGTVAQPLFYKAVNNFRFWFPLAEDNRETRIQAQTYY